MVRARGEQRNRYEGTPQRPWTRIRLMDREGVAMELRVIVDTGSPCALIVSDEVMQRVVRQSAPDMATNFGDLAGGWVRAIVPGVGLDAMVVGYGSDPVVRSCQQSSRDFAGLIGLPLLRMTEFGGDADWFWLREPLR